MKSDTDKTWDAWAREPSETDKARAAERLRIRRAQREALRELADWIWGPRDQGSTALNLLKVVESATRAPRRKRRKT